MSFRVPDNYSRCQGHGVQFFQFYAVVHKMEQIHTTQDFDAESSTDSVEQAEG